MRPPARRGPPPAGLWQFLPLDILVFALYQRESTPVCPCCHADSTLTAYVAVVDDEVRCERCRTRSTRALVVRLIAEDGYAVDRAEALTLAMAS